MNLELEIDRLKAVNRELEKKVELHQRIAERNHKANLMPCSNCGYTQGIIHAAIHMKAGLLPCPFCGGRGKLIDGPEAENRGSVVVECQQCHSSGPCVFGLKEDPKPKAVQAWNRRSCNER
jgi:Lar family restriction alleviation protein